MHRAAATAVPDIPAIMRLTVDSWVASSQVGGLSPVRLQLPGRPGRSNPIAISPAESDSPGIVVGRVGQLLRLHQGRPRSRLGSERTLLGVRQSSRFLSARRRLQRVRRSNAHPFVTRGPMATQGRARPLRAALSDPRETARSSARTATTTTRWSARSRWRCLTELIYAHASGDASFAGLRAAWLDGLLGFAHSGRRVSAGSAGHRRLRLRQRRGMARARRLR